MSNAISSKGVLIQRAGAGSPDTYQTIAEMRSFSGPDMSMPTDDVTNFDSTWGEHIVGGIPDGGEVSFAFNWVQTHAQQQAVQQDFAAGTMRNYRIQLADSQTTNIYFQASITRLSISSEVNRKVDGSMTLKVNGAVTIGD